MQHIELVVLKYHEFGNRDLYLLTAFLASDFEQKFWAKNLGTIVKTAVYVSRESFCGLKNVNMFTLRIKVTENNCLHFEGMVFFS